MLARVSTGLDRIDFALALDLSGFALAGAVVWECGPLPDGITSAQLAAVLHDCATEIEKQLATPPAR